MYENKSFSNVIWEIDRPERERREREIRERKAEQERIAHEQRKEQKEREQRARFEQELQAARNSRQELFFESVKQGDLEKVEYLLEKDHELINAQNKQRFTAMNLVPDTKMAELLLAHGVEVREDILFPADPIYSECLKVAETWNLDVVRWWIDHGGNIDIKNIFGNTPLLLAAKARKLDIVKYMVEQKGNVIIQDHSLLRIAVENHDIEMIKFLIEQGADVRTVRDDGRTVLHEAISVRVNIEIARLLLQRGADVDAKDKEGITPLFALWASYGFSESEMSDKWTATKLLIENGASCRTDAEFFRLRTSPLHEAAKGNLEMAKYLLDHGADPNFGSPRNRTPLLNAIDSENYEMVKLLLERGADTSSCDKRLCEFKIGSPLHLAVERQNFEITDLLIKHEADVNTTISYFKNRVIISEGGTDYERDKYYPSEGQEVYYSGVTPLHIAMKRQNVKIVALLLKHGADPAIKAWEELELEEWNF